MSTPPADPLAGRAELFRLHVEPELDVLLRVARTLTRSWTEAEDLTQETLVRAWRALDRFDGAHPRAWLLTILRHTHVNMHRRHRPDTVEDVGILPGARPAFGAVSEPTPEEQLVLQILPDDLERAVDSLGPKFQTVLVLVDINGLTYAEVAELLDVPLGTVMSRLSRARQRVRAHLHTHARQEGSLR
ncbi:RNA polymerase subunit sigma-70 [Modestobacter sp. VKM Ac-2676]|nr:RNA polymerase subunit sigma-70 [Modestobacter sp. VKM Ac-2676]